MPQGKRQGPRFKISSERLSPDIDIVIQSSIQTLTKLNIALKLVCAKTADRISMQTTTDNYTRIRNRDDLAKQVSYLQSFNLVILEYESNF